MEKLQLDDIGEVCFLYSRKNKNIRLSIKADGSLLLTSPHGVNKTEIIGFLLSKKNWIKQARQRILRQNPKTLVFSDETNFSTLKHKLKIHREANSTKYLARVGNNTINIYIPSNIDIKCGEVQQFIKKAITEAVRAEAKAYLPLRLKELADIFRFKYNKVALKNNKSNWGSCSAINNINLNIHLMRLPTHLIDYVILHELCHTIHKNHGEGFWAKLDETTNGNAKKLALQMKDFHPEYF